MEWAGIELIDLYLIVPLLGLNVGLVLLVKRLDKIEINCNSCGKEMPFSRKPNQLIGNDLQHPLYCRGCCEIRREFSKEERKWDLIVASKSFRENIQLN